MVVLIDPGFAAPRRGDEAERQKAVERSGMHRRKNDPDLLCVVEDAVRAYQTAYAALTIIDQDRQWLVARVGLSVDQTPRDQSFCAHAIHRPGEPLVVGNAALDPRFASYSAVRFAPHVRFYAGMPIVDRAGYALGALCVFDYKPRTADFDAAHLMLLARRAERVIGR